MVTDNNLTIIENIIEEIAVETGYSKLLIREIIMAQFKFISNTIAISHDRDTIVEPERFKSVRIKGLGVFKPRTIRINKLLEMAKNKKDV